MRQSVVLSEEVRLARRQSAVVHVRYGMHHRNIPTRRRDSQRGLQQDDLPGDLCEREPIEVTWVKDQVQVANLLPTRLYSCQPRSKPQGVRTATTYG